MKIEMVDESMKLEDVLAAIQGAVAGLSQLESVVKEMIERQDSEDN